MLRGMCCHCLAICVAHYVSSEKLQHASLHSSSLDSTACCLFANVQMSFFSAFYQVSPSAITKTIGIIAIPEHQLTGKTEYFLTNINLASIANT